MNQREQALEWAIQYLASKKYSILSYHEVVRASYSVVYEIKTTDEVFYLKQAPEALFSEPKVLEFLNKQGCGNIPNVLAENNALYCFLMTSCGDISLRNLFKGEIDLTQLTQGISNYTEIQRLIENKAHQLLSLGIPDWRLNKFASLYYKLIQQNRLLLDDGLTRKEIESLYQLYPKCIELCEELSKYKIPETIGHCDFHENNMLIDKKTGTINIIDWGETVIAHPFFSLMGCLWNITYFYKQKQDDLIYRKLQSHCVTPWLNLYDEKTLLKAFNIASQLNGAYAALGYERMYFATENQPKTVRQEHGGAIAGCLKRIFFCKTPNNFLTINGLAWFLISKCSHTLEIISAKSY